MNPDWRRRQSPFGRRPDPPRRVRRPADSSPPQPGSEPHTPSTAPETDATGLEARIAELEERWRRCAAELDNANKRCRRELEAARAAARKRAAEVWLPVVDNLELALAQADADPESIIQGVRAVYKQAVDALAGLGFPQDADRGVPFDPNRHYAVAAVPATDYPDDTVVEIVRPGYGTTDDQLRPASVTVAKET